jgi:hypothetical protein
MGRDADKHEEEEQIFTVCIAGPVSPRARTSRGVMIPHEANGAKFRRSGLTEGKATG